MNLNVQISYKNQFPNTSHNPFMNVLSMNIQSIRNKINNLTTYVESSKIVFHIIVLTETHIKETETKFFNLPGYSVEHCVRKSGRFGGASIFVRNDFSSFNLIHKLDIDQNNSLLINIEKYNIKIAAIYRQRTSNFENFLSRLEYILDNYNNCYIFGDFNLDLFNLEIDDTIKRYHDRVSSNGFIFLNSLSRNMPTRVDKNRNTSTCIDHVITDSLFHTPKISYKFYLDDLFGDHKAILLSVFNERESNHNPPKYFTVKRINHEKIISESLFSNIRSTSFSDFQSDLKHVITSNTTNIMMRDKFKKPFMTKEVLNFITIKQNYFRLKKKYPNCQLVLDRYKKYRNIVNKKVVEARKVFNSKMFNQSIDNPSATWCHINNLLRNTDKKPTVSCTTIKVNGTPITNKYQIVESFNSFFTTVADSIHNTIVIDQNVYNTLHTFEQYPIVVPFQCPLVTSEEILFILSNLSNSKAEDLNGVSNHILKKYRTALYEPLKIMINKCLDESTFPECLKIAKVRPLFKSGDKTDMNNYRPIAITPIDAKCFESVILERIETHLKSNNILCPYQFGYTKNSNCESAVLHVLNCIYKNIENKLYTAVVFIDLTKAFDCLLQSLLFNKLSKLGFSNTFLQLLKSYLSERYQYVELEGVKSPLLRIYKGVFQGSTLAAVLFLIYINSIFTLPLHGKLILFADDMSIVYGAPDLQTLRTHIDYDLNILQIWLDNHYLKLNATKTKYILFHGRTSFDSFTTLSLNIKVNNQSIERVSEFQYLGFWLDEEFTFQKHVKYISSKIIPMTFAIKRIRPYISEHTARQIYFAHIHSHLSYMNPFWNIASDKLIETLAIAQRKCLRFIFNKFSFSPSSELFSEQILPLKVMNEYNLLLLAFKITNNLLRNNVELQLVSEVHEYNTRQRNNFYISHYQTSFGFANFFTRGMIAFNNLEPSLKRIRTVGRFKHELRHSLYQKFISSRN